MNHDVIVIGAGAAGLMTAITAAQGGKRVVLLDGQKQIGAKILMSGGTRCNVTNKAVSEKDYNSEELMVVRNTLRAFDNERTINFFKDIGVELVLEPTGKYFPTTNSGQTVLDALMHKSKEVGVALKTEHKVKAITFKDNMFTVIGEDFRLQALAVVVTTGGLSYPGSGSDGVGYMIAQSFGHHVVSTTPSLTPFSTTDKDWKALSGISLEARLSLFVNGKKDIFFDGGFLFTHLGYSGPTALDISRHWLRAEGEKELFINFIPKYNSVSFDEYLVKSQQENARKTIKSVLMDFFPERLALTIIKKAFIDAEMVINQLSKAERKLLVSGCVHYPLEVSGVVGYTKAEATAGGVDLGEVNPKTLQSFLQPGLFFAGEVLDVDGRIGGFNFQWAWASGHAVGTALVNRTKKDKQ